MRKFFKLCWSFLRRLFSWDFLFMTLCVFTFICMDLIDPFCWERYAIGESYSSNELIHVIAGFCAFYFMFLPLRVLAVSVSFLKDKPRVRESLVMNKIFSSILKLLNDCFTLGKRASVFLSSFIISVILACLSGCFLDPEMNAASVGVGLIFGLCLSFFVGVILHYFFHKDEVSCSRDPSAKEVNTNG